MSRYKPAILLLEDGTAFDGESFGAGGEAFGEAVFNTAMTGYQEVITDPSYAGQLVAMTYPHIGNYGLNPEDVESRQPFLAGFIVREDARVFSNYRAAWTLDDYLGKNGIVAIKEIDTRSLTKHLRTAGAMKAAISTEDFDKESLSSRLAKIPSIVGQDLVKGVTVKKEYIWPGSEGGIIDVVLIDYGAKQNIMRELTARGCKVTVVPAATTAEDILRRRPHGVILSNGPGTRRL